LGMYYIDNGIFPNRENGITSIYGDSNYVWRAERYRNHPNGPQEQINWAEFRTKMSPYIDMDTFEKSLEPFDFLFFQYAPVRIGSNLCPNATVGRNFQRYSFRFYRRRASGPPINEYYWNSSGRWDWHCVNSTQ